MRKNILGVMLTVVCLLMSIGANAKTFKVILEQDYEANSAFFTKSGDRYVQTGSSQYYRQVIKGEGILAGLNRTNNVHDNKVVGKDIKGHSYAWLTNENGKIYLHKDFLADITVEGIRLYFPVKIKAEVESLTNRTWQDYLNGDSIILGYTEEGRKVIVDAVKRKLQFNFSMIQKQIAKRLKGTGATVGKIRLEKWEEDENDESYIRANLKELWLIGSKMSFKLSFTVSIDM